MMRRQILGPEALHERTGSQLYRDPRTGGARLVDVLKGPASGFILAAAAIGVVAEPASIDVLVPLSMFYATWVLTCRIMLPLRLPSGARRKDYNHPQPGRRKPRISEGIIAIGNDYKTQQELWIGNEDGRQHVAVPGTTGAGKTEGLLSLVSNALMHDSGFIFVDGKADNRLYAKVCALARKFGREDDVLVLNFLVASGNRDSNTFNPFSSGNADVIRELLVSQIEASPTGGHTHSDTNHVFMARAVALMGALTPALVWIRDNKRLPIDIEKIRFAVELQSIASLALEKRFRRLYVDTGQVEIVDVSDIPEAFLYPLRAYLGETGGYDSSLPYNKQKSDEPAKQHSFVTMHFSGTFTQLAVSLGHVFRCEVGDIDMRDVVLNRRILVVNLPTLENSGETTAALGKIVVAALRNMMAQTLGASLEGDYQEIVANKPSMAPTPFPVVLDEVGYYVVPGMDKMLAMGRGLGFMFYLGFQEVAGLHARIGETMYSLLGNANFQILMRLQEGSETRRYVEHTAGDTNVMQLNAYHANDFGCYREARHAEIRRQQRVDWNDLRGLIEGEAIILFGATRVYAKLFHAEVNPDGPMRLNRPVALPAPDAGRAGEMSRHVAAIREAIIKGWARPDGERSENQVVHALVEACREALDAGEALDDALDIAIAAAAAAPLPASRGVDLAEPGAIPPAPPTELDPMMRSAGDHPARPDDESIAVSVPVTDTGRLRDLAKIEELAGVSAPAARIAAKHALTARDMAGVEDNLTLPTPLAPEALRAVLDELIRDLQGVGA
jgi:intracellular multiplication protein IcmO